jgi:CHASE3 domain sensor protein
MSESLKEELSELRQIRASIEEELETLLKEGKEDKKGLKDFYGAVTKFVSQNEERPEIFRSEMKKEVSRHLKTLSEHTAQEATKAFSSEIQELNRVTRNATQACEKLQKKVGWRTTIAPSVCGISGFCVAFALVWWSDIGLRKISSKDMASLSKIRTLYRLCTTTEQNKIFSILESAADREIKKR